MARLAPKALPPFWRGLTAVAALLGAVIFSNCARVVEPGGGPKDSLNPQLVRTIPQQGQLNYKGKVVVLEFSELIGLNAINQQLIVSPVQDNPYLYKVKRNRLELEFEKPFPDSATVFLNFRQAIQDLTEKNTARNVRLAFSTGGQLDTLMVSGQVIELLSGSPRFNTTVGLWPESDTVDIRRQRPQYLAATDSAGFFRLENVRQGRYQAAAFADGNGNARWSGKSELLDFTLRPFTLTADTALSFALALTDDDLPRLERIIPKALGMAEVRFTEGLTNLVAFKAGQSDTLPLLPIPDGKGAAYTLFLGQPASTDTLRLRFIATDSAGLVRDTIGRMPPYRPARGEKADTSRNQPFTLQARPTSEGGLVLPGSIDLTLPEPVPANQPLPEIAVTLGQQTQPLRLRGRFNLYRNVYSVALPYAPVTGVTVITPASAFTTVMGQTSKADTATIAVLSEEQVGLIRAEVRNPAPRSILQLLDAQGRVLREVSNPKKVEITGLPPANYQLRLLIDANQNGRYEAASYRNRRRAEPVIPPAPPIQVKANWEVEGIVIE